MKALVRWVALLLFAFIALQLFFVGRIAAMAIFDPQSTTFQRSEAYRIATEKDKLRWRQQWVPYERISDNLKRAVIASEDGSFTSHEGVDWEALEKAWEPPKGWRRLTAVNNSQIGLYYLAAAFVFFIGGGVLALIMRTQLAVPDNTLVSPGTFNQLFTMHGTVMMFLFAVPAVEAMGVLLLPNMLGARDLPFPRLSVYAFWAYAVGGLVFFGSIFFELAPRGGWFMYPPLISGT